MTENVAMCRHSYNWRQVCTVILYADELYCLSFGLVYWIHNAIGKMRGFSL